MPRISLKNLGRSYLLDHSPGKRSSKRAANFFRFQKSKRTNYTLSYRSKSLLGIRAALHLDQKKTSANVTVERKVNTIYNVINS